MRHLLLLASILVVTLGCTKDEKDENQGNNLTGKFWTLKYIQNASSGSITFYPNIKEKVAIEFSDKNQLNFDGVCNGGAGDYAIENEKLTISNIFVTQIYCNNIEWEEIVANGLQMAYQYKLNNRNLVIYSNTGYNLVFE